MALFNIRWPGRAAQADGKRSARSRPAVTTESVDALRRRARHRLIGAAVLLVAGVVGFPVLFDTQPRPIPVDIPIAVPERGQAPSVVAPSHPVASAPAAPAPAPAPSAPATVAAKPPAGSTAGSGNSPASTTNTASTTATTADSLDKGEEVVSAAAPRPEKPVATPVPPKAPVKPAEPAHETARAEARREAAAAAAAKPVTPPAAATAARDDDAARARALLDGQPMPAVAAAAPAATDAGRFVVQVGAFGDAAKAQEARAKLTRGGLKTYVQQVDTKDGKRIRVRVGPFANKAEADRAAAKVKGLDLPASILVL